MGQLTDQSVRHAVYLERYKSGALKEYAKLLGDMENAIIANLSREKITAWNRGRLERQLTVIQQTLNSLATDVKRVLNGQIIDLSTYEVEFEVKSLKNVIGGYDFNIPSDSQITSAVFSTPLQASGPYQGQLLEPFMDGWSQGMIRRVNGAIRLGFAQGITTQQLVSNMMAHGGVMDLTRRELESVVRTGLAHSASVARQQLWSQNESVVEKVRITATLDQKTSSTCRSLDGKEFKIKEGPRPPFHIRCRTTTTAVLSKKYAFLDKGRTRSARNPETGKVERVSSDTTYYSWLKRQPAAVQDSMIGPTRGKLLRNGGISTERFAELQLGKNFQPLTLDEMRKLEPIAFHKANL